MSCLLSHYFYAEIIINFQELKQEVPCYEIYLGPWRRLQEMDQRENGEREQHEGVQRHGRRPAQVSDEVCELLVASDRRVCRFGAGSEFGRDQREEARRKKFGIITRRYKPDDQPWLLKIGGKMGKK